MRLAVSVNTMTRAARFAQRSQGAGLRLGRLGQHRVQGDDDRHREPVHQLQHVTTDLTAEDAELVLDQHDVDASVEVGGRRRVVRRHALPDRADHVGRAGGFAVPDHGDDLDFDGGIGAENGVPEVTGEDRDAARSRGVGGDDRHCHRRSSRCRLILTHCIHPKSHCSGALPCTGVPCSSLPKLVL